MTRSDLIEQLALEKNLNIAFAERVIQEVFGSMADTLAADGRIEIRGFGSFENREYGGYTGRNPKTGELVSVAPKKRPFFKVGKELREIILVSTNHRNA